MPLAWVVRTLPLRTARRSKRSAGPFRLLRGRGWRWEPGTTRNEFVTAASFRTWPDWRQFRPRRTLGVDI